MNSRPIKIALVSFLLGLLNACANTTHTIGEIESVTHKGYCSKNYTYPLSVDECKKKLQAEIHGKPEKSESEKMMDGVNKAMSDKEKTKANNQP